MGVYSCTFGRKDDNIPHPSSRFFYHQIVGGHVTSRNGVGTRLPINSFILSLAKISNTYTYNVGQTKRDFGTRLMEHLSLYVKKKTQLCRNMKIWFYPASW